MNNKGALEALIAAVFILAVCTVIGAALWPYTINTWLAFFGKQASIVWWQGALMGFCPGLGQATIPAAIITWLLMLFIA
jgi:hypothetical protein